MPEFILRVGTPEGDVVERPVGRGLAARGAGRDAPPGAARLRARAAAPSACATSSPASARAVSTERFLLFNQELLALVRAGLPIVQSFDIMLERQKNPRFREILAEIREKITSGVALSDAFASYGDLFPPIYSTSLRAGERSGDLEGVLKRFLRYQKMIVNLRKRVVGAMVYPAILDPALDGDDLRDDHLRHPEVRRVLRGLRRGAAVVHAADDQRRHVHCARTSCWF